MEPVKRQARVAVVNQTSTPLIAVSVVHRYSNVYKNRQEWPAVLSGKRTESELIVDYHTGWATAGKDWWLITWYSEDLKTIWYSNPNNFRWLFYKLHCPTPDTIKMLAPTIAGLGSSKIMQGAIAANTAACELAKSTTDQLFNSKTTEEFKQHTLLEEDAEELTQIVISPDYTITFKSESGISETVAGKRLAISQ